MNMSASIGTTRDSIWTRQGSSLMLHPHQRKSDGRLMPGESYHATAEATWTLSHPAYLAVGSA